MNGDCRMRDEGDVEVSGRKTSRDAGLRDDAMARGYKGEESVACIRSDIFEVRVH
jgi:hypothetical protein